MTRITLSFLILAGLAQTVIAQQTNALITLAGKPALRLKVPTYADITVKPDHTVVQTTNLTLHLWLVPEAKAPNEAVPRTPEIIKSEFVNFKPDSTNALLVAGSPAKHVIGKGNEADDGDPGGAEVIFFQLGRQVFAACVHGESDEAARHSQRMISVLQTAMQP